MPLLLSRRRRVLLRHAILIRGPVVRLLPADCRRPFPQQPDVPSFGGLQTPTSIIALDRVYSLSHCASLPAKTYMTTCIHAHHTFSDEVVRVSIAYAASIFCHRQTFASRVRHRQHPFKPSITSSGLSPFLRGLPARRSRQHSTCPFASSQLWRSARRGPQDTYRNHLFRVCPYLDPQQRRPPCVASGIRTTTSGQ
ncbi:hypothetical protein V8C26DRAFT_409874 [Trichoderma gracile]